MSDGQVPPPIVASEAAFFLDLDGTLAPIVDDPAAARLDPTAASLLERLIAQTSGALAIVSGRSLTQLDALLAPLRLPLAGSHGLELRRADGGLFEAPELDYDMEEVFAQMRDFAHARDLLLERKPGAIALHYRTAPAAADASMALVDEIASRDDNLRALHGKMVSEVTLAGIDKGSALRSFMTLPAYRDQRPVMVGDDVTDEDGFAAAQSLGGFGLKIGPGPSCAQYRVATMEDFLTWLAAALDPAGSLSEGS
ncbi:trehalose-phosphatase [Sulfitobacter aestuarii]|uniref:Trehalose 6-phosphate phosphatase n=1 Tax=Sulfitobacter aestuarii TaxID=2161676 RepID=A0ABW5U367_9RHOB